MVHRRVLYFRGGPAKHRLRRQVWAKPRRGFLGQASHKPQRLIIRSDLVLLIRGCLGCVVC